MNIEAQDLLLEVIGEIKDFNGLPGVLETQVWRDARVGDYSLKMKLETPGKASVVLEALRDMGLTPLGARFIEARAVPISPKIEARPISTPRLKLAHV
jgi:hypothetical protein